MRLSIKITSLTLRGLGPQVAAMAGRPVPRGKDRESLAQPKLHDELRLPPYPACACQKVESYLNMKEKEHLLLYKPSPFRTCHCTWPSSRCGSSPLSVQSKKHLTPSHTAKAWRSCHGVLRLQAQHRLYVSSRLPKIHHAVGCESQQRWDLGFGVSCMSQPTSRLAVAHPLPRQFAKASDCSSGRRAR